MQEKKEEDLQQALNKVSEVGIDEVGRGAIFGPVFSAVVILTEKNKFALEQFGVPKFDDTLESEAVRRLENAKNNIVKHQR